MYKISLKNVYNFFKECIKFLQKFTIPHLIFSYENMSITSWFLFSLISTFLEIFMKFFTNLKQIINAKWCFVT